ncbi:hypothetical protein [Azohydromonas aeria]|uniref:hypothetical protein n=1 Tax=Azohydromonas aeria TaxID=2590212 RepID=UPI0012F7671B
MRRKDKALAQGSSTAGPVEKRRVWCSARFRRRKWHVSANEVFAKLKQLLRRMASRTVESLWDTIGELLHAFSPNECSNYIRHCGYGRSG